MTSSRLKGKAKPRSSHAISNDAWGTAMTKALTTVNRKLQLSILKEIASAQQAASILKAIPGVSEADLDASGKRITLCYDAAKLQYPGLLQALAAQGLLGELSWWGRFKSSWYKDQDIVTRDNAKAKPSPCCSNPTSIIGHGGKTKRR